MQRRRRRARRRRYAELIGGRYFNVQLDWNKQYGNPLYAPGKAKPKTPTEYKIVGKPIQREDVAPKVFGSEDFVTDMKVPGMLHGRMIRPPVAGARAGQGRRGSIKDIPGARVVCEKGFLGVVADKEWDAIQAAREAQGRVVGGRAAVPRPGRRSTTTSARRRCASARSTKQNGNVDDGFKAAARVIEAEYEWPFQSHASMGPACALVEIKDGKATLLDRLAEAALRARRRRHACSACRPRRCTSIWMPGPGSYGRNDAGDAAMDAAVLAKAVGKPVRVQYMRDEGTGWDPKGPASIHRARAAIDAARQRHRLRVHQQGLLAPRRHHQREQAVRHAGRPGTRRARSSPATASACRRSPTSSPTSALAWETIAPLLDRASPLRTSHLRDPVGPADPLRQRVLHRRGGAGARQRSGRVPAEATSRTRATSR